MTLAFTHPPRQDGATTAASASAIQAIAPANRYTGLLAYDSGLRRLWGFDAASSASDTTGNLVLTPSSGTGRWIRAEKFVDLKVAVGFGTADAATLFTVPTGFRLRPTRPFWEVTTPFSGGSSSAIGLSSSNAAYNTKGDLLGGAAGDLEAALTAGMRGAIGAKVASLALVVLVATDTIRFDRIVSVYTAGAGFAHIPCELLEV